MTKQQQHQVAKTAIQNTIDWGAHTTETYFSWFWRVEV